MKTLWDCANTLTVMIKRHPTEVWPYLFPPKSEVWSKQQYVPVAGESGKVGEIYAAPYNGGQFLHESIKVERPRELVLKLTYSPRAGESGDLIGYDIFTLAESDGSGTTLVWHQAFALPIDTPKVDIKSKSDEHGRFLGALLENLKGLVEV